jgi:hypothetical protein
MELGLSQIPFGSEIVYNKEPDPNISSTVPNPRRTLNPIPTVQRLVELGEVQD